SFPRTHFVIAFKGYSFRVGAGWVSEDEGWRRLRRPWPGWCLYPDKRCILKEGRRKRLHLSQHHLAREQIVATTQSMGDASVPTFPNTPWPENSSLPRLKAWPTQASPPFPTLPPPLRGIRHTRKEF